MNNNHEDSIAIIGMACRFPGANNVDQLWQNLAQGVGSIRDISDDELREAGVSEKVIKSPNYIKRHAGPENVDMFDANFFGISPDEARYMDVQHRFMLECAYEALEDANINIKTTKERIGVFGGIAMPHYMLENLRHEFLDVMNLVNPQFSTNMNIGLGNDRSYASSRVSNKLNLQGPAINVDAACATSMFSMHLACKSLLDFEIDVAVAGAARIQFPYGVGFLHEEGGMSSPQGDIFSFDKRANGTMFTNGAGCIILKRVEDAIADGDNIVALIRGSAINNDGNDKVGFTAPSLNGQRKVIFEAQSVAEVDAAEISYIEAHGTGTSLGDPLEFAALKSTFEKSTDAKNFCHIGTLKPNLGHMEAVSGIAGVIKVALMLNKKKLLPNRNFVNPNPEIDLENSPFQVSTQYQDWETDLLPRKAGVSSFGVGGNNGHIILEEYVPQHAVSDASATAAKQDALVVLSAKSQASLDQMAKNLAVHIEQNPHLNLNDVAYTSQYCRQSFNKRYAFVASDLEQAVTSLRASAGRVSEEASKNAGKVSFMFPGQGSQHVGMIQALYEAEVGFKAIVDECALLLMSQLTSQLTPSSAVSTGADEGAVNDIRRIMFAAKGDPVGELINQTQYSQPALFVSEYALAKWWMAHGVKPEAMIGHSIGEYVAACLAGVFSLESALAVVAARGRLMQSMPKGDMLSVNLSKEDVLDILPEDCDLAAHNAPHLTVVSAPSDAIDRVVVMLEKTGARATRLKTSHAFHSRMMEPILNQFKVIVEKAQPKAPNMAFVSNVSADWITDEQATSADYWVSHLRGTVNFSDGLACLISKQKTLLLEVGPGTTLSQLAKKQEAVSAKNVFTSQGHPSRSESHSGAFAKALAGLWCKGAEVNWDAQWEALENAGFSPKKVTLPTYVFEKNRYIIERKPRDEITSTVCADRLDFEEWFSTPTWQRDMGKSVTAAALDQIKGEVWLVWANASKASQDLMRVAANAGVTVLAVYHADDVAQVQKNNASDTSQNIQSLVLPSKEFPDFDALVMKLKQSHENIARSVSFWAVDAQGCGLASSEASETNTSSIAETIHRALDKAFYSQMNIVKALDALEQDITLTLVSNGTASALGTETLNPAKTAIYGILRVAPAEYERIACQHIDLDLTASRGVNMLLGEILSPADNRSNSAIRGHYCWRESYESLDMTQYPSVSETTDLNVGQPAVQVKAGGTYLITGGMGGIGLLFAKWLVAQASHSMPDAQPSGLQMSTQEGINLVLVGRSQMPASEHWQDLLAGTAPADMQSQVSGSTLAKIRQLSELQNQGVTLRYAALDVTDASAVEALVRSTVDEFGVISGIMHSAGVAGDGIISLKTQSQADAVILPKVQGAYHLHAALQKEVSRQSDFALDFFVLNSSLYAVVGGAGQVDYCAANNMLDAFAHQESSVNIPILSINWGPWENLGMTNRDYQGARANLGDNSAANSNPFSSVNSQSTDLVQTDAGLPAEAMTPLDHPLLDGYWRLGDDRYQFNASLAADKHWVLDEHRIGGEPVVPGTALIDMLICIGTELSAVASDSGAAPNTKANTHIAVSNLLFLRPINVSEQSGRILNFLVEKHASGFSVAIESTDNGVSQPYAMADIERVQVAEKAPVNVSEMRFAHQSHVLDFNGKEHQAVAQKDNFICFGPRWASIKEVRYANNAAFNQFQLNARFHSDLNQYAAHPALLDLATGIANGLWLSFPEQTKDLQGNFLPSGYDQIVFHRALPQTFYAESRLVSVSEQGAISFDIDMMDEQGECLIQVSGFRINRVEASEAEQGENANTSAALEVSTKDSTAASVSDDNVSLENKAILPAEGELAFARLLGMTHMSNVVVCNRSLGFMLNTEESTEESSDQALLLDRPDIDTEFAVPQNDTQKALASLWVETIGVKQIGINDNFYDVGGDSLVATKLVANIRRHFDIVVALDVLLANATIAELADYIDALLVVANPSAVGIETGSDDVEMEEGTL